MKKVIYAGYREEKEIEWQSWEGKDGKPKIEAWAKKWVDDLTLVPDGTGFWVNGPGVRGLRYEPNEGKHGKLLGRMAKGRKPEAFLMVDGDEIWICVKSHRKRVS